MNSEKITEFLNKVPVGLLLFIYLAILGYDYYNFQTDPSSSLLVKRAELAEAKSINAKLQEKFIELDKFIKTLEVKKVELHRLVEEFQQVGGSLSDQSDTPRFMKMIVTEAKKLGVKVESLKPTGSTEKEFYLESVFSLSFRGFFGQLMIFFQRLAMAKEVIRLGDVEIRPNSVAPSRFIELTGVVEIRTYSYLAAKAAAMVKQIGASGETLTPSARDSSGSTQENGVVVGMPAVVNGANASKPSPSSVQPSKVEINP